ncbi:DUF4245 domain-containing protein [Pseudonocardia sp. GCM10023141]|uniref:DUF4245 domain-containing protein n=1 Tax=Pseudonocardia sp. GCM10023141 TaxID=3252653 RepID=UPI0036211E91
MSSPAEPERSVVPPPPDLTPLPPSKPPRSALRMRDMVLALGALLLVVLVTGGLSRSCSFAPGGPTVDRSGLPVVDAPAELRGLATRVPFPVRIPAVPADWRSNSTGQDVVGDTQARSVRVGYVTAGGTYVRLVQSDASEEALLAAEKGKQPVAGQGTVDAGGQTWVVYGARPATEPVWIATVPGPVPVRLVITGSGTDDEFRTVATAVLAAQPQPLGTPH